MRLLFVHECFGALGGAEANVLVTATALKQRGHTVGLLHGSATGKQEAEWSEVFEERFSLDEAHAHNGAAVRGAIDSFRPDAIFLHTLSNLDALDALATAAPPVVRMVHDHSLYCLRGYKYNPLTRQICTRASSAFCVFPCAATVARTSGGFPLKWVSYSGKRRELEINRQFDRLIVATEFMRAELLRNDFSPEKIEIHAPVPEAAGAELQPTFAPRNRIVYAGQIIRGKGVDVLLESLARVQSPFECIILGDGKHRGHCEELSRRLGLAGKIFFKGFVAPDKIVEYYREATLAVMSSVWPEPFGATGLEAMRCGLPVVAFDAGGIREWLIDEWNGFLVPWMDRSHYAASVDELLGNKALARKMGAHARQWVGERWGFPKYIDGLEDLFTRITATQRVTAVTL